MVMRAMRDSAKWMMLILVIAFVGWLVLDWVESRGSGTDLSGADPVVGKVAGKQIRYSQWNLFLQSKLQQARQTRPQLTEEDARLVQESAWNELVSELLLQSEIERLGIQVTDSEIRQAFRTRPPPEFMAMRQFQDDQGQFDLAKYQQYFANPALVDERLLLQLESYYRRILPREKLANLVSEGVYVSDREAWQYYRDVNERVRARYVSFDPALIVPDSLVKATDDEIRAYHREHEEEFARPAAATVNLVSISLQVTSADSAAALARAESLRRVIVDGEREFEEVATAASADSASGALGGLIGTRVRGQMDPALDEAAFSLPVDSVSEPIETAFGYHLIRVDSRSSDTVSLRHIVILIEPSPQTEDSVFDLMDRLEELALRGTLASAADSVGLAVRRGVSLTEGSAFVPGAGALGVAPEWALDPTTEIGELSQYFESGSGFHIFELLERQEAGTFAVEEVAAQIRDRLLREKKKERAREVVQVAADSLAAGAGFEEVARRFGGTFRDEQTFRRVDFVAGLGQGTEAIGAAFGLAPTEISGVVDAGDWLAVLQVLDRTEVTRDEFEPQRELIRQQLSMQRREAYWNRWFLALRESADIVDLRDQLAAAASQQS